MARLKGAGRSGRILKRTLGDASVVRIGEALDASRDWLSAIKRGDDPYEEAQKRRTALTIAKLIGHYLNHQQLRMKPRSYAEMHRHLMVHARPLHRRSAVEVTRREIVELLEKIAPDAPVTANHVRSSLSALFTWGMKAGLVPANPVAATFKPAQVQSRSRVLSDDELAWVWSCTTGTGDYGRIVRLAIATGARRSEIAGMRESELMRHDDGSVTWTIPGERTKNGLPLELALPAWIAQNIPYIPSPRRSDTTRDLLFGEGAHGFNNWPYRKSQLDKALANAGHVMEPWVLHDLRRTFVTRLNDLGVDPHVIEALVNHVSGAAKNGVAGVYNKSAYRDQKRQALVMWSAHVKALVEHHAEGASATRRADAQPLTGAHTSTNAPRAA
jgi:integrase